MTVLRIVTVFFIVTSSTYNLSGQTLFTYGNKMVSKSEFLKAYNKNNSGEKPTEKSYRDYLELYSRFKIKLQAAIDLRLDTLPHQRAELLSFRNQVADNYMNDEASLNALISEATERSKKDIRLSHILVLVKKSASEVESKNALNKINQAHKKLINGEAFEKVAKEFSEDPGVQLNNGEMGYITVFSLPYDLENLAYSTPAGKFSRPVRSAMGYHMFKNLEERKAVGRIRIAQVLLSFPPDASASQRQSIRQRADSVYRILQGGANFGEIASKLSDDNFSYQTGGELPEFGVGRYDPVFEKAAFNLSHDGEISAPILTQFGYHIIKRLERKPITDNQEFREAIKAQVLLGDRMKVSKKQMTKKMQQLGRFKKFPVNEQHLQIFSDSIRNRKNPPQYADLKADSPLFSFEKQAYFVRDWQRYLERTAQNPAHYQNRTVKEIYEEFIDASSAKYYRDHLEEFDPDFAWQLNEFKEGNLLFEIMQSKIWDSAATDSVGLKKYYEAHKNKYWWDPSADAIIFTSGDATAINETRKKLQENPADWKKWVELSNGTMQADSGRFEWSQLPVVDKTKFTAGLLTAPVKNDADKSTSFSYIVKTYPNREPRDFENARGFVINDYQALLEEQWIAELKKKYPVKVNEEVFKKLLAISH